MLESQWRLKWLGYWFNRSVMLQLWLDSAWKKWFMWCPQTTLIPGSKQPFTGSDDCVCQPQRPLWRPAQLWCFSATCAAVCMCKHWSWNHCRGRNIQLHHYTGIFFYIMVFKKMILIHISDTFHARRTFPRTLNYLHKIPTFFWVCVYYVVSILSS